MPPRAIVAVLLLVGCHSPTGPAPFLSGTITSRAARVYTVQLVQGGTHTDSVPQMKVEEQPGTPLSPLTCETLAYFTLANVRSVRYANGLAADTSALIVGTRVRVWVPAGPSAAPCPPTAPADVIVIVAGG